MPYVYLGAAVLLNVGAYAIFRAIAHSPHDAVWALRFSVGLALGAANLFFFTTALKHLSLSVAYPVFSGATISLMVITAALFFGERVTASVILGCAFIVLGAALLTRT